MPRIIHIEQWFHPSYGYQVQQFIPLHSKDFEIYVITSPFVNSSAGETAASLAIKDEEFTRRTGAVIIRLPLMFHWRGKLCFKRLKQTIQELNPSAVFCHGVEFLPLVQVLKGKIPDLCPVFTDCHDLPTVKRNKALYFIYQLVLRFYVAPQLNRRKITTYFLTNETKDMLLGYGIKPACLRYLPLGVDGTIFFPSNSDRLRMRQALDLDRDDILILYTGKCDDVKTPHILRDALELLPDVLKQRCKIVFLGAQDTNYVKMHNLGFGRGLNISLKPSVPYQELASYYRAADIGCWPAQNTLSCLEAQSCGLPVVMQDDSINRERLLRGGRVFKQGDLQALAEVLAQFISDSQLRLRLGEDGMHFIRSNFDYQSIVNGLDSDIREAIENHSRHL